MTRSAPLILAALSVFTSVAFAAEPAQPQAPSPATAAGKQASEMEKLRALANVDRQLFTVEERLAYFKQMREAANPGVREQIRQEHQQELESRAKAKGISLQDLAAKPEPGKDADGKAWARRSAKSQDAVLMNMKGRSSADPRQSAGPDSRVAMSAQDAEMDRAKQRNLLKELMRQKRETQSMEPAAAQSSGEPSAAPR